MGRAATADADRIRRALEATNAAVVKLAEAIPNLVVVGEDDPLARDLRDAVQLARLSDAIAAKIGGKADGADCPPPNTEPGSGMAPNSPHLDPKTGPTNI